MQKLKIVKLNVAKLIQAEYAIIGNHTAGGTHQGTLERLSKKLLLNIRTESCEFDLKLMDIKNVN